MFDTKNIPIHEKSREVPSDEDMGLIKRHVIGEKYESYIQATDRAKREDLHVPGAKDDGAKVDLSIILECFPRALWEVGRVADYGARKYSRGGCLKVKNAMQRYEAADMRHKLSFHKGEERDQESGMLHLAHCAWNALIQLEIYLREKEIESKKGA